MYGCLGSHAHKGWLLWAVIASVNINIGILFIISATVHKVKAELIKKQKHSRRQPNSDPDTIN
jgi:hypothetical protein